jgi:nucleotide-binding universal stress UspA family protein
MQVMPVSSSTPILHEARTLPAIRRILVALDGTPHAEPAMASAATLARAFGAEVMLVLCSPVDTPRHRDRRWVRPRQERFSIPNVSLYLSRKEHTLRMRGVRTSSRLLRGQAPDALMTAVLECDPDLVILATHASAGASTTPAASDAVEVLNRNSVSVLLLAPASRIPSKLPGGRAPTIVVPLSAGTTSALELHHAARLARALAGEVLLLSVASGSSNTSVTPADGASHGLDTLFTRAEATRDLERHCADLAEQGIAVRTMIVDGDLFAATAMQIRRGRDVLVLGLPACPIERTAVLEDSLMLLRDSGVPLLLIPAQTVATERERLPRLRSSYIP